MRKTLAISACCVALGAAVTGCGIIPSDLTERTNRWQQEDSIDKPYAQAIKDRMYLQQKPIGTESLGAGRRIIKHVGDFGEESGKTIGPYHEKERQIRIVYFLVDADDTVKDWATLIHKASGKSSCVGGWCIDRTKQPPIEELDQVVKTSRGANIATWRSGG